MASKKQKKLITYPEIEPLTADELRLLIECPYKEPGTLLRGEHLVAKRLIERGLLERDPSSGKVRCTDAGEKQAAPLSHARVQHERDRIYKVWLEDGFEAQRLERVLWMRIIVECALGGSRQASIALETCDFIENA